MDGAHDLGGMHGFGALTIDDDAPLFHERWESRVWALQGRVCRGITIDRFRWTIEQMPPAAYLASSYYERWLWALERLAAEQGLLDGDARPPPARLPPPAIAAWTGRFSAGDLVRVRNATTAAHTRVPRYLRLHHGTVERVACVWPDPTESASTGRYGEPELVYTVAFAGADLFGPDADHTVTADLGEGDLEPAGADDGTGRPDHGGSPP